MKYYLEKQRFYNTLKNFSGNKHTPVFFFHSFGDNLQYTICFNWAPKTPAGKPNFIASCQLYDNKKSGSGKYITKDLIFDMMEEGVTTDYKLYKFLREWTQKAINAYECEIKSIVDDCKDCGFCV